MLASRLSSHSADIGVPTAKQRALLQTAFIRWIAVSEDQILSQLLLQLLLLAHCIPTSADLEKGTPEACAFLKDIVTAVAQASWRSQGELIFAEVQLSFVITSALRRLSLIHI